MIELGTRRLGCTEMHPYALGLGCASLGRPDRSDAEAIAAVRHAIELGINYIDTSPHYRESERRIGLALKGGLREKIYLQTKTGTRQPRKYDYSAEATRWSVENSLKLLKTEYLDAVLIHDPPNINDPLESGRALDVLQKFKEKGIVRHIGLGCRQHNFHRAAIETGHVEIVLTFLDYTLLNQSAAVTTLPLARKHDVGIELGSVLEIGLLTGKEPENHALAHAMWQWCRDRGVSIRRLALRFCLALPMDGIVLVGAGTKQHVEEAYLDAITEIPPEIVRDFGTQFHVDVDSGAAL